MLRDVNELFLAELEEAMPRDPNGAYEPLFLLVKDIENTDAFNQTKVHTYTYEVLGGHSQCPFRKVTVIKHPQRSSISRKMCVVFAGLNHDEALFFALQHNKTGHLNTR